MMACPGEFIWPNVGDQILLVDLKPAPQDVQCRSTSDKAPALGSFLSITRCCSRTVACSWAMMAMRKSRSAVIRSLSVSTPSI